MAVASGCYGQLSLRAFDRHGNVFKYDTPNTLTFDASVAMSHLLVGDGVPAFKVARLAVGTGTTPTQRTDSALGNEVHQLAFTEILYPAVGQVEFVTLLEFVTPANGFVLTEAGLLCDDGTTLFGRQVHTGVEKDQNFRLEYRWRLVFT